MKSISNNELEQSLLSLKSAKYPKDINVVDSVMASIADEKPAARPQIKTERRVRWTIGAISSLAAASVALLLFVGNGNYSHAQVSDNDGIANFLTEIFNSKSQADVEFYSPDYIDILLDIEEE